MKIIQIVLIIIFPVLVYGQNMGVGTTAPTEKLEVAGKIFTNQGGIKFPDNTVQTTAAYNETVESVAMPRGIGFIKFSPPELAGEYDTLGLLDVSIIYSSEILITKPVSGAVVWGNQMVTKLNDLNSQRLLKYIALQTIIPTVRIYLTRETTSGIELYYETELENVTFSSLSPALYPGGDGGFAHTDEIGLRYERITFFDYDSNLCYCFNIPTLAACTCP